MIDPCKAAREAAAALLQRAGIPATAAHVRAAKEGAPLASPLPRILGMDENAVLAAVKSAEEAEKQLLFGVPAFKSIEAAGGHILFTLTDAAYSALADAVNASCPIPPLPAETQTPLSYALARMHMLAGKGGTGCPDDAAVQRALWQSFRIAEEGLSPGEGKARSEHAARLLLTMMHHLPPAGRAGLANRSGAVGAAAARLLAFSRNEQKTEER